jgi:hypothetical protein
MKYNFILCLAIASRNRFSQSLLAIASRNRFSHYYITQLSLYDFALLGVVAYGLTCDQLL